MNSIEIDDIRIDGGCSVIRREKKPKFHIIRVLCAALWWLDESGFESTKTESEFGASLMLLST